MFVDLIKSVGDFVIEAPAFAIAIYIAIGILFAFVDASFVDTHSPTDESAFFMIMIWWPLVLFVKIAIAIIKVLTIPITAMASLSTSIKDRHKGLPAPTGGWKPKPNHYAAAIQAPSASRADIRREILAESRIRDDYQSHTGPEPTKGRCLYCGLRPDDDWRRGYCQHCGARLPDIEDGGD